MSTVAERVRAIKITIPSRHTKAQTLLLSPHLKSVLSSINAEALVYSDSFWIHRTGRKVSGPAIERLAHFGYATITKTGSCRSVRITAAGRVALVPTRPVAAAIVGLNFQHEQAAAGRRRKAA